MKEPWKDHDIIDVEYFIATGEENNTNHSYESVHIEDRELYNRHIAPQITGTLGSKNIVLKKWLEHKTLNHSKDNLLPGQAYKEFSTVIALLFSFLGILLGLGLTISLLSYDGITPVNIFSFLGLLLIPQTIFLFFFVLSSLFQKSRFTLTQSIIYTLLAQLLSRVFFVTKKHLFTQLSGKDLLQAESFWGQVHSIKNSYGKIFYWPIFSLTQLFAIFFNISVLATLLIRVATTDIAFGWQSTMQFGEQSLSTVIQYISTPWSSLITHSHPTLAEISGSHIILKEGVYHLTTPDLASWWPFLFMTILVYGLLPRIALLIFGRVRKSCLLKNLTFEESRHKKLFHRLTTPVVSTQSPEDADDSLPFSIHTDSINPSKHPDFPPVVALIPEDIFQFCHSENLEPHLIPFQFSLEKTFKIQMDLEEDEKVFNNLQNYANKEIFILLEAWMPPISDTQTYLKKISEVLPPKTTIYIGLVGKPENKNIFTKVSSQDLKVWQGRINSTKNSSFIVSPLIPEVLS